jgi:hypothetical protein
MESSQARRKIKLYASESSEAREPGHWDWSSYRHHAFGETGPVLVNEEQPAQMKIRAATG